MQVSSRCHPGRLFYKNKAVASSQPAFVAIPRGSFVFGRHGYRIDVQGAQDSVSGLEYGRILNQMRRGDEAEGHADRVSPCPTAHSGVAL